LYLAHVKEIVPFHITHNIWSWR